MSDKSQRNLTAIDRLIGGIDRALKTVSVGATQATRISPARPHRSADLDANERLHVSGLMRVNHTGEVCAQALYQGQALTAHKASIRQSMRQSAKEEEDHLAWCEERLGELGSRPSVLNPIFYSLSFSVGALAGLLGDKWSLGFVAATEDQVCQHLRSHLQQLPHQDKKSKAVLEQMLEDEAHHANVALDAGGITFNKPTKKLMTAISAVMTNTTYRI